jgi:hypothetical protein
MPSRSKSTSRRTTAQISVDDIVLSGVLTVLVRSNVRSWSGTMTELQTALVRVLGKKRSVVLPGSPGALRVVINRVVNRLRNRSVSVRFTRTPDHARTRVVRFSR